MRGMLHILLAVLALMSLPSQAEARDLRIAAAVGQLVRVFGHVRFADDCEPGPIPEMAIVAPPLLGELSSKVEPVTLTSPDFGRCPTGLTAPGKVVYYTARNSGHDTFHYRMSSAGQPTTDWVVTVDVP
jgi:hypothetical protein